MASELTRKISENPEYQALKSRRNAFSWALTLAILAVYFGYILVIAFDKSILAAKLGAGVMTVGIPVGLGIIVFTIAITGLYVLKANSDFDPANERIIKGASK